MFCCSECIGDRGITRNIFPFRSKDNGTCSYCQSEDRPLVAPTDLKHNFELLVNIYSLDDQGMSLVEWFMHDWAMFPNLDQANARILLSDILDDGEIVRKKFSPSDICITDRNATWAEFRAELMHKNRFFPQVDIDKDRLRELLDHIIIKSSELPNKWYRARIQHSDDIHPIAKMGAPPEKLASQGRANPAGIPYLYLGSTPETCVSEIRPHTGESASVADFSIQNDLKFIDLRNPRYSVSPFILSDENEVALLRGDLEFLVQLGNELTRPVIPHAAAIDYLPSQYLCEFIKKCGYKGVVYNSSTSSGINLALFEPALATSGSVEKYCVSKVTVVIDK